MNSKLVSLVICASGLTLSHGAVAGPDQTPDRPTPPPTLPDPIPSPPPPDPMPTNAPLPAPQTPQTPQAPQAPQAPQTPETPQTTPVPTTPEPPPPVTTTMPPDAPAPTFGSEQSAYAWGEPRLMSGIGVAIAVGGGITGFTDKAMRDTVSSNVSGLWDLRASLGTRTPIGVDISYLGSAASVNTLTGSSNGTLIGSTAEAAIRFNIAPHQLVNPYVFAGAGWSHYNVRNMSFAQSDTGLKQSDDIAEFPMGAGVAYRSPMGLTVDVRGTFRAAMSSTLLLDPQTANYADLHTWEASAALGYEF